MFRCAQVSQALTLNKKTQSSQNYYLMNNEKQKYSRGLKTSILGPKLGSFLVQFFFDDYSFFMKKAIFFFVLHEELKTEENATSKFCPSLLQQLTAPVGWWRVIRPDHLLKLLNNDIYINMNSVHIGTCLR